MFHWKHHNFQRLFRKLSSVFCERNFMVKLWAVDYMIKTLLKLWYTIDFFPKYIFQNS